MTTLDPLVREKRPFWPSGLFLTYFWEDVSQTVKKKKVTEV